MGTRLRSSLLRSSYYRGRFTWCGPVGVPSCFSPRTKFSRKLHGMVMKDMARAHFEQSSTCSADFCASSLPNRESRDVFSASRGGLPAFSPPPSWPAASGRSVPTSLPTNHTQRTNFLFPCDSWPTLFSNVSAPSFFFRSSRFPVRGFCGFPSQEQRKRRLHTVSRASFSSSPSSVSVSSCSTWSLDFPKQGHTPVGEKSLLSHMFRQLFLKEFIRLSSAPSSTCPSQSAPSRFFFFPLPQWKSLRRLRGEMSGLLLANRGNDSPSSSTPSPPVRRPVGFENFYPQDRRSKKGDPRGDEEGDAEAEGKYEHSRKRSTSNTSTTSGSKGKGDYSSSLPPPPPPPPPGGLGAAQRQIVKVFCWAILWGFAVGTVLRGSQKQLSMQEFLSNYVARGLVERVEVLGERGDCRAVVWETPAAAAAGGEAAAAGSRRGWLLQQQPPRHIVRFRTGMSPETFTEKMESFQASLGIHPRDYLPVYIEEQREIRILDLLASAFFFLLLVNVARDLFFSRMRRGGGGLPPGAGGGGLSGLNRLLGSSTSKRARVKSETVKVRFSDVAGLVEAKREITEFVSFLKHPQHFQRLGAKLPKGALLVGPPGTGKTLLAKAVAGEAEVPFFSVSGSDFVEVFVGVGASRVRELFDEARKAAPSIIFIDEIDSVGGKRSTSFGNSEREQTLNQLLVEMDGFTPQTSVVVLAGTNRDDLLDEALKRPGRFDRVVQLRRPDVNERKDIFKVHLKPLKLSPTINSLALAERMAALTPGLVGADIANLCNEAAIQAARRRAKSGIEQVDFELAAERTIAGLPSAVKNLLSPFQRRAIAFHECGHCVAGWFLKHAEPVLKLTIIPRSSGALGFSQQMPPGVDLHQKDGLLDRIAVCLGGRAAEEIFVGSVSTGAGDDIQKASRLARLLVMQFGMSDSLGLVNYAMPQSPTPAANGDSSFYRPYSEYTAQLIDEEVKTIIQHQYHRVTELLRNKEKEMRDLCDLLLKKESITYSDIRACIGPRPVALDPQLAAYVEALPTTAAAAGLLTDSSSSSAAAAGEEDSCEEENGKKDKSDDEDNDRGGGRGGGGGRRGPPPPRSLDDNDDASIPEKVREKVRAAAAGAAAAAAARAPQQQPAAVAALPLHSLRGAPPHHATATAAACTREQQQQRTTTTAAAAQRISSTTTTTSAKEEEGKDKEEEEECLSTEEKHLFPTAETAPPTSLSRTSGRKQQQQQHAALPTQNSNSSSSSTRL